MDFVSAFFSETIIGSSRKGSPVHSGPDVANLTTYEELFKGTRDISLKQPLRSVKVILSDYYVSPGLLRPTPPPHYSLFLSVSLLYSVKFIPPSE